MMIFLFHTVYLLNKLSDFEEFFNIQYHADCRSRAGMYNNSPNTSDMQDSLRSGNMA